MATNNIINSPLPTMLSKGGTNAALTASNGGIFYSTASAGAILAGTATANQILLSGSSTTPAWSTATYPATTTANQLLYSSSNSVVGQITAANSTSLITNSSGVPTLSSSMTDGQIIIGSTSGTPTAATLTAGTNVTITNSSGSVTINSGLGASWVWIATDSGSGASLNFNNKFSSSYVAYRIILRSIVPAGSFIDFCLRLGTGAGTYLTTGYIYQAIDVNNGREDYSGYTGSTFDRAYLTDTPGGIDGLNGKIDLFVTSGSSKVANGISQIAYVSNSGYQNSISSFQRAAANYTSVQLLFTAGNVSSGSAYLYGLLPS